MLERKMRSLLVTVCGLTLLACCWLAAMEWLLRHPGFAERAVMDGLLAAASLATGLIGLRGAATGWRWLGLAAALAAGAAGGAAIVGNARSAHFEGFALLIGAALCLQAGLALWVLAFRPPLPRPR